MSSAEEFKLQGNQAFVQKDFQKAAELFTKAIELDPSNAVYYSNRSGCWASLNNFEKALEDAEKCLANDPKFVRGYSRKGLALFKLDKVDEALEVVEQGLKIDPNNDQLKKDKASMESTLGSSMNDIMGLLNNPEIQKMMKENPQLATMLLQNPNLLQNPQMMQFMANMMANKGGANAQANPTTTTPPPQSQSTNFPDFNAPKPETKPEPKPQPKTESAPQPPKATPPPTDESEFAKTKTAGNNAYKEKKFEEAIKNYDKCIELNPNEMLVRNNKAACFIELKKYDDAHATLDAAIEKYKELSYKEKDPTHYAKLMARKGRAFFLQGKWDESIDAYNSSLLEDRVAAVEDQLREVKREKKKADELAYINPEIADKHRELGNDFFNKGDFGKAMSEYEEARRRNPKDARIYNNMAMCFIKMMKFNEALKEVEKALELDPKFVKAMLRKAVIHNFLKEYHKAIDTYKSVLEIEPENKEAQEGIRTTQMKISTSMGEMNDEERVKRAMADPQIQAIMSDPMVRIALEQMQSNSKNIPEYLSDRTLGPKIEKLIQAGIIRMG